MGERMPLRLVRHGDEAIPSEANGSETSQGGEPVSKNGKCEKPFIQIYRDELLAAIDGLPHPAVHLLMHLVFQADYSTHVYDARSLYELRESWGFADGVTRRAFEALEERGHVEMLPDNAGIFVAIRERLIPLRSGGNPLLSGPDPLLSGVKPAPLRGARPAETRPYITHLQKQASEDEIRADFEANGRHVAQIRKDQFPR